MTQDHDPRTFGDATPWQQWKQGDGILGSSTPGWPLTLGPLAFPRAPEGDPGSDRTWQVPRYPPYIPESQFDTSQGMPRTTVDCIHGTGENQPVRWKPSHPGELPPYWMNGYLQDQNDPGLW
jgi:hypothetical protein